MATRVQPDIVLLKAVGMWIYLGHLDQNWVTALTDHVVTELGRVKPQAQCPTKVNPVIYSRRIFFYFAKKSA